MIEIGSWNKIRQIVSDDYTTYSGKRLERYFREQLIESQSYTQIDTWWNRTGTTEIDLIAIDELSKQATFFEIKRQRDELDLPLLDQRKADFLTATRSLKGYTLTTQGLSLEDM